MIPYEDLCAALDAFRARSGHGARPQGTPVTARPPAPAPAPDHEPPTAETHLPVEPPQHIDSIGSFEDDGGTHVGGQPPPLDPVFDDRSNEIDVGDVLADEEP